jgi:hypothetical protein
VKWLRSGEAGAAGPQQAVAIDRLAEVVVDAIVANQDNPENPGQ